MYETDYNEYIDNLAKIEVEKQEWEIEKYDFDVNRSEFTMQRRKYFTIQIEEEGKFISVQNRKLSPTCRQHRQDTPGIHVSKLFEFNNEVQGRHTNIRKLCIWRKHKSFDTHSRTNRDVTS